MLFPFESCSFNGEVTPSLLQVAVVTVPFWKIYALPLPMVFYVFIAVGILRPRLYADFQGDDDVWRNLPAFAVVMGAAS